MRLACRAFPAFPARLALVPYGKGVLYIAPRRNQEMTGLSGLKSGGSDGTGTVKGSQNADEASEE